MLDYMLIKQNRSYDDMYQFLCYVTGFLKQDLLGCKNVLEFERKMWERALTIEDYDFYTCLVNAHNQTKS